MSAAANANPQGGSVAGGSASIVASAPGRLDVNQSSDRLIVNWQGFSIGAGEITPVQSAVIELGRAQPGGRRRSLDHPGPALGQRPHPAHQPQRRAVRRRQPGRRRRPDRDHGQSQRFGFPGRAAELRPALEPVDRQRGQSRHHLGGRRRAGRAGRARGRQPGRDPGPARAGSAWSRPTATPSIFTATS
ncbi:MAG: hypothetical protein WDO24_26330 [Pseudomonadota bacterium]